MPAPRNKSLAAALCAACITGWLGAHAATQDEREKLPIVIDASSTEGNLPNNTLVMHDVTISQGDLKIRADKASVVGGLNYQNSKWTISGGVRINAQGGSLSSDEAVVTFTNNVITRAIITGAPAEFEGLREGATQPARGRARTIDYETASGNVSLKDDAWLSHDCNELTGPELVYNIKTQSFQGQTQPGNGRGGQFHFTIQPKTASDSPCAKPASEQKP